MNMKASKLIPIIIISLIFSTGISQERKIKKATEEYDKFAYIKTSDVLLKVANNGFKSVDLFQKLGNSFYFNNKMKEATKWYKELMALNEPIDAEYYFRYALALKYDENYTESDKWMTKFHQIKSNDSRGQAFINTVDYLTKIEQSSRDFKVYNLDINSSLSDFGATLYKNNLVFASSRGNGEIYKWNDQPYLDLYTAIKEKNGIYKEVTPFDKAINTKYHESSAAFSSDNTIMYFTRNNYHKKSLKKDEKGISRLQLFRAKLQKDSTWSDIKSIHFNSNEYSVAHPTVNSSNTKLYFASDISGTKGQSDIFVADINTDGSLGEPINLGSEVNTEGQETFPFINSKGDLYFSSNGHTGLGGLDVYVIRDFENKRKTNDKYLVENIGKPINSPQDDFGYYENPETEEGLFSSNRPGGKGDDDIYSFTLPKKCSQLVEGIAFNKKTRELLPETTVILFNAEGVELDRITVDNNAAFTFQLDCNQEYLIRGEKETYTADEKRFTTPNVKQELNLELELNPNIQSIKIGDDLSKVLEIPIIYFNFDKHNIRNDAALELAKVLAVLDQYPQMEIAIRSHTDSRGSFKYNERLSNKRAKSTMGYLIKKGIAPNRLTSKGYGESKLINTCSDGVKCSEKEHQLNRRSEFIITKM